MIKAGQDPSMLIKNTESPSEKEEEDEEENIKDPLVKKIHELEDENVIAFRLAKEGLDTVYNIGHRWTYNMAMEGLSFLSTLDEIQDREIKKQERNT